MNPPKQPSLAVLRRLWPYVLPMRGRLLGSAAAALGRCWPG
ncbi:MAG TPA: hypothetical protein VNA67_10235 [Pseudonocardiaceae bacterium]|nr:hypothetical protein [Pseudonocardiaceae bacterium]